MISVQVVSELSGVLFRTFDVKDTTDHVNAVLSYPMEVVPVTPEIVRLAASYSRDWNITPYDGIHVVTAISENAEAILSADKELGRVKTIGRLDPLTYRKTRLHP